MANKSYVIWNNKGGVGKSTITFHVATVYAQKHPEQDVIVIDMCPQANSSMMILGGGKTGEKNLQHLISQPTPKTVVGYITDSLIGNAQAPMNYYTQVSTLNSKITDNLYLLAGDGNLELVAPMLSERANARSMSAKDKPWEKTHSVIRELVITRLKAGRDTVYFIDTNPSFSIYTEIAILSGENLLVPINADDSSIYAITGLFNLIYGSSTPHPIYGKYTFANIVHGNGMQRPRIHLLLGNRFTQKKGAAHAYKALSNEATSKMWHEYQSSNRNFRATSSPITTQADFEKEFSVELRDFNSAGVVAANLGIPLNAMDQHTYQVYGEDIQVSKEQRELCKQTIENLVSKL